MASSDGSARQAPPRSCSYSAMNRCPPGTRPSVTDWWAETRAEAAKSDTSILRATLPSASRVNFGEAARGWLRWARSWDGLRPRPPTSLTGRRTCACSRPGEEGDRFGHLATRSASARDTAAVSCAHGSSAVKQRTQTCRRAQRTTARPRCRESRLAHPVRLEREPGHSFELGEVAHLQRLGDEMQLSEQPSCRSRALRSPLWPHSCRPAILGASVPACGALLAALTA